MAYVVIVNTPGYLPDDDDPPVFGELADAKTHLANEVEHLCEFIAEGYLLEDPPREVEPRVWWSEDLTAAEVTDPARIHDLGRCFSVQTVEEEQVS